MANKIAEKLGYTNEEAVSGKHIAMNMSLTNAIRMGLVVNPKLVSCLYGLKDYGDLSRLKEKIEKIENIELKNEKLEQYETLRKNIEKAEGIPELLQSNVKKGGKYIVFLPVVDELEDEDGNVIGRKTGTDKIKEYEKQIAEYFEGSDITPSFHSLLGEYSDKKNAEQLKSFQNNDTEETEFLLVMNKANEGLHLDNLDGMIWLRPLDKNSRILYLQQLGRVIYSEDPDNPTKDEDRPVVIDIVNNTLKVNWEDEITEQDDIQILNLVVNWQKRHNGILPNINSTDREETGYARILKEIQNKYKKYLKKGLDGLNEKQLEEVKEIIKVGNKIDLWQIQLPERTQQTRNVNDTERSLIDRDIDPFEITGYLKDFVDLENEVDEIERANLVVKLINTLKLMKSIGVDVSKIVQRDTIETLAAKSGISKEELEKIELNPDDKIGSKLSRVRQAYMGKGTTLAPTKEEVEEFEKLEINIENQEQNVAQEFIDALKLMKSMGIDISKISSKDTIESLAAKSGISKEELERVDLDPTNIIGNTMVILKKSYRGQGTYKPLSLEQTEELKKLGINLEKRNAIQDFIDTLKQMKSIGIDISKMSSRDTIETAAARSGVSREEIEQIGLDPTENIGNKKSYIIKVYRENDKRKLITNAQEKELKELGISLEKQEKDNIQEFIDTLKQMKAIGVDVSKIVQKDTIETLAAKSGISKEEIERIGLEPSEKIGEKRETIRKASRRKSERRHVPTEEQERELEELLKKQDNVQKFIDMLKRLNSIKVDVSKIEDSDTIESLAAKSGIGKEEIKKIGLEPTDTIGDKSASIKKAYKRKGRKKVLTDDQAKELKELGITFEKQEKNVVDEFIDKIKRMKAIGVDISKITQKDTIETAAAKSGISIEEIKKVELDPTEKIGVKKTNIVQSYRGKGNYKSPTEDQAEELKKLGIMLEKQNTIQKFIDTLNLLQSIGVDISKLIQTDTIETLAAKSGMSKEELEKSGLEPAETIGAKMSNIVQVYRGKEKGILPTNDQKKELKRLGIKLEKQERNVIQEFIDTLKQMKAIGVDVSKLTQADTIETLALKSGVSKEELEKIGLDPTKKIGNSKGSISKAYRGKGSYNPPTREQVEEIKELGINFDSKSRTGKEVAQASISALTDIEMLDEEDTVLKGLVEKRKKEKEGGTQLDE